MVTDTLTHMPHNDPAQYTVLGWVKIWTLSVIMNIRKIAIFHIKFNGIVGTLKT